MSSMSESTTKEGTSSFFTPISYEELWDAVREWTEYRTDAKVKYGSISTWNTERITDMSSLFHNAYEFDDDIGAWDVSNVTDMNDMFSFAHEFNADIGNWDVSNVTNMCGMFTNAF